MPPAVATRPLRGARTGRWRSIGGRSALILPLVAFVLVVFVLPIGSLLLRSVDSPEVRDHLPRTSAALDDWDGVAVPPESVCRALGLDLLAVKGTPALGAVAARLNRESPGMRTLLMKTARRVPPAGSARLCATLATIDAVWATPAPWQVLARASQRWTLFYLLAAVDHTVDASGHIVPAPPAERLFIDVLGRTLALSAGVTLCCLLLGYPLAYVMAHLPERRRNLWMIAVLLPFWTSVLVRVAAWIVILQNEGIVNRFLMAVGLITAPLPMLFNKVAVYIAMVHILLPFMVLPLLAVMRGIPAVHVQAALSLGCPPVAAFRRVYLPQTLPGVGAGGLLVFIICMGYYITPALLGGPREQMLSYFIAFYTNGTINWGMAAALSLLLMAATLLLYLVYARWFSPDTARRSAAR